MSFRILNLLALSSLAILACSFCAEPVNALSSKHHMRDGFRGHEGLAKRKRSVNGKRANSKRCQTRAPTSATSGALTSASSSGAAFTPAPTTSTVASTPTSSSSSAAAVSTSTSDSPSSVGGAKGCLAWPNGDQSYLGDYKTDKTNVIYTWGVTAPSNAGSLGFTFAPQLWGPAFTESFSSTVVEGYSNIALGFNEPNEVGQSNMDPGTAASLWIQYMEPLKALGYRIGSPATSSNPDGLVWMQQFFAACAGGCNPDFMALHWYDISASAFMTYVELWHTTFNLPIWITEYAYQDFNGNDQGDLPTIQSFMGEVNAWMDQQDYVEQYCWFGAMLNMQGVNPLNTLMNSDGSPSSLGEQFLYSG